MEIAPAALSKVRELWLTLAGAKLAADAAKGVEASLAGQYQAFEGQIKALHGIPEATPISINLETGEIKEQGMDQEQDPPNRAARRRSK